MTKVLVSGASGKMGCASIAAIQADSALTYVGGVSEGECLASAIKEHQPEVVVDFTVADVAMKHATLIIDAGVCPVIGTSGFNESDVAALQQRCESQGLGGVIAPNFAIGAVLMMQYAAKSAKYFDRVEIIESHHDKKKDAPSGTAVKTAEMITAELGAAIPAIDEEELLAGARGADSAGVRVHSLRLPGVIAEQAVVFGASGQTFRIEHRSTHRDSFMPGVVLACKKVPSLDQLYYGLEHIL